MKNIKKKLITSIIFICSLFFSVNYNLDVNAQEINEMGTFPSVITLAKDEIVEVSFIKDSQANIDARFNAASIKADLTSGQGSVKGWLEVSSSDSSKYELYVASEGTIYLKYGHSLFYNWSALKEIEFDNINTSKVTSMVYMFSGCWSLEKLDLSKFDTSNVTSMHAMFYNCSSLTNFDLSSFNTSKVTDMRYMFSGCKGLTTLDLSKFDTSNVTSMYAMFDNCSSLTNFDLSSFNTNKVTSMGWMFSGCSGLTSLNINNFDTSSVTDMSHMFSGCKGLITLDLSNFDTSKVTNMSSMFYGCKGLTSLDVSNFDTRNVTTVVNMFQNCGGLTTLDLSNFDTSNVIDMSYMFSGCNGLTTLDLSNFDTKNITKIKGVFQSCSKLTKLNINNFNTSNVTDMSYMFFGCSGLTSLNINNFNTSKVTDMGYMFFGCSGLTSLNINNFDTSSVTDMSYMFSGCSGLTTLDLSNFDTSKVTNANNMFNSNNKLQVIYMNQESINKISTFDHKASVNFSVKQSNINTLKTLVLSSGTINFNPNTMDYNIIVNNNVTKITISSTLTDEKSTYVSGYGNREVSLKEGLNTVLIKVQAENGDIKTYTLNITRIVKSNINTLKTLTLSSGKINFNPNTINYNLTVNNNVEKITISSALTDEKSTYVSGYGNREVNLNVGLNTVLIKVKSENGDIRTYTLNITRKENVDEQNNNADIMSLYIENYSIDFNSEKTEYSLKINDEMELNIEVVPVNENSSYEILNNNNLKDGSVITIKVTSPDKSNVKVYKINIKKDEVVSLPDDENKDGSFILYIVIGILSVGLISFGSLLVYYNKKESSDV